MEVGTIRQINIENEMQASYLDYAMSVIVARALPDVRDGLKPVHRRILYAMYDLGLTSDKPYKKSARIVGEVLGKYHPHGDAAVYEAMVRMAQDFSLRYPLVDGQGNFGSVDGDNAAAMRYTEARLASIANEMLADIEKDTVDWTDNFDGTLREPSVLPAALPNLLVNGASGIAVGMATNIPPHNLGEVCDALCYLIDHHQHLDEVTIDDLMHFVQGPDFPTGGVIFRYEHVGNGAAAERVDAIERAYGTGRGSIVMQAKAHIEEMSRNRSRIVVTELPYQTDKSRLLERIAELVRDGRLEGITDLRDESDRTGMRVCIEMTRTADPRKLLADLYKLTPLQSTFGVSLLALVDGEPRYLSLKKLLMHFLEHRQQVIVRRSRHDLEKARARAHILEGLLRALDLLDEIIALIRRSRTADIARQGLIQEYQFSEIQAQAILDMQLRRLAALERQKLQDEYKQIQKLIKELEELLASPKKQLGLIKQNLIDLKARYDNPRRTQIADRAKAVLTAREHTIERDVWVVLRPDGRLSVANRGAGEQGGKGDGLFAPPLLSPTAQDSAPQLLLAANTRQDIYVFGANGRMARILGHQLPDAPGAPLSELSDLKERVVAMLAFTPPEADECPPGYVLLGTVQGKVKRVTVADLCSQAHANPQVIGLDEGDELVWAGTSPGEGEVLVVTSAGQSIRFAEEEVRSMGLPAGGIGGIKLRGRDCVVAGLVWGRAGTGKERHDQPGQPANPPTHVLLVTAAGYGKRVPLEEFPVQGRHGVGVTSALLTSRSGNLVAAALLSMKAHVACYVAGGQVKMLTAREVAGMTRATTGKLLAGRGEHVERTFVLDVAETPTPEPNGTEGGNGARRALPADDKKARAPGDGQVSSKGGKSASPARTRAKASAQAGDRATTAPRATRKPDPGAAPQKSGPAPEPAPSVGAGRKGSKTPAAPAEAADQPVQVVPAGGAAKGAAGGPAGDVKPVARSQVSVTFDKEELLRAAGLGDQPAARGSRSKQPAAGQQLPLVGDGDDIPYPQAAKRRTADTRPAPKPAAPHQPSKAEPAPGSAGPDPAGGKSTDSSKAKRLAADGPMTWPLVPPDDGAGEDAEPPPPKRRAPRAGRRS